MHAGSRTRTWRVGHFAFDPDRGELSRDGTVIRLQPQPLELLRVLLKEPGKLFTREELRRSLWPEQSFLEFDDCLNHAVLKLREALGDSSRSPAYIETIPRRGYRFIAPVEGIEDAVGAKAGDDAPTPDAALPDSVPASHRHVEFGARGKAIIVGLLVILATLVVGLMVRGKRGNPEGDAGRPPVLAVLEIHNLSLDHSLDWVEDGLPELLTSNLAQAGTLQVLSHESIDSMRRRLSRHGPTAPSDVAGKAGANLFLTGSVTKNESGGLRLDLRVQDVANGKLVFADTLEGENVARILTMVNSGTAHVLQALSGKAPAIEETATADFEAYRRYQAGQTYDAHFYWDEAIHEFQAAVGIDPQFPQPHLRLFDLYRLRGEWGAANAELQILDSLRGRMSKETLRSYQVLRAMGNADEDTAVLLLEAALQESPRQGERLPLAVLYANRGQPERAIELLRQGVLLDPSSDLLWAHLAYLYAAVGNESSALQASDRYLQLVPGEVNAWETRGDILYTFGRLEEAVPAYEKAYSIKPEFAHQISAFEIALIRMEQGRAAESLSGMSTFEHANHAWPQLPAFRSLLLEAQGEMAAVLSGYEAAVTALRASRDLALAGQVLSTHARLSLLLGRGPAALRFARAQRMEGEQFPAIALLQAGSGDLTSAESSLQQYVSVRPFLSAKYIERRRALHRAWSALLRGDGAAITAALAPLPDPVWQDVDWITFLRGVGLAMSGHAEAAQRQLGRAVTIQRNLLGTFWVPNSHSITVQRLAHFYLAAGFEASGDRGRAAAEYRAFLAAYRRVRPSLPQVAVADNALKRLS